MKQYRKILKTAILKAIQFTGPALITIFGLVFSLLPISKTYAQQAKITKFTDQPKKQIIEKDFANESAVILDLNINIQYIEENKEVWIYRTLHRLVKVLTDNGIESFNKISIDADPGSSIEDISARTITNDGKIYDISSDMVKISKTDGGGTEYLFAMEGVAKDAEIELQFTEKKPFALFGGEFFQFHIPLQHAAFQLSVPARLGFETKGYLGFPKTTDTLIEGKRHYIAEKNNIAPIHDEEYASVQKMRMHLDYKLSYLPQENPGVRVYTWSDLAKYAYKRYYSFNDKGSNEKTSPKIVIKAGPVN